MRQIRPNGVMEDSPLPSPVTSPKRKAKEDVSVGGQTEHRQGVKRSLEGKGEANRLKGDGGGDKVYVSLTS